MRSVGLIVVSASLLLLAGCESQQERDANRCASWGYEKGSSDFADCMKEMTIAYEQGRQQEMNAAMMYAAISSIHSNSFNGGGSSSVVNRTTNNYYVTKQKTVNVPSSAAVAPKTTTSTPAVTKPIVKSYTAPSSSMGSIKFNTVKSFGGKK